MRGEFLRRTELRALENFPNELHTQMMQARHSAGRKRVVIVGSAGRPGSPLAKVYQDKRGWTLLDRERLDLGDLRQVADVLEPLDFDRLIPTAALTAVAYCESNEAEVHATPMLPARLRQSVRGKESA